MEELVIYVSPDGDDKWSGKLDTPNPEKADGPVVSLERARDIVRQTAGKAPATVLLRGGTYFLEKPFVLLPEDSGTEDCPVTYACYPGETAILSGGQKIEGWEKVDGKEFWRAKVDFSFNQLWVNRRRRRRARHPKQGYLYVESVPDATPQTPHHEGQLRFRFRKGELDVWHSLPNAELVLMTRWTESHLPVERVDEKESIVYFRKKTIHCPQEGDAYYIENLLEALTEPGEWYLDTSEGLLYYIPLPDEDMRDAEVIAPVLQTIIRIEGRPEKGEYVNHITFRNLTISHTGYILPEDTSGINQASWSVPGAILAEGARYCTFEKLTIEHIGTYGLELSRGCQHNRIQRCSLSDLGAGGIKIGETIKRQNSNEQTFSNEILQCHISNGGVVFHSAVGVWIGESHDNRLACSHIHDFYYSGISIGWTWGYGKNLARNNIVEYNHIHHIGVLSNGDGPILSDMGGIYTLGVQPGTVIRDNKFHDIAGFKYGGWGIYFDEGSTGIVAENNIVYNTTHGAFHQHYGKENTVRNNIFAFSRDQQVQISRPEPHLSVHFHHNILYWRKGIAIKLHSREIKLRFEKNLYFCVGEGELRFDDMTFEEWQELGIETDSVVADPLFRNPDEYDFTLAPTSPAFPLGFIPFETG